WKGNCAGDVWKRRMGCPPQYRSVAYYWAGRRCFLGYVAHGRCLAFATFMGTLSVPWGFGIFAACLSDFKRKRGIFCRLPCTGTHAWLAVGVAQYLSRKRTPKPPRSVD